LDRVGIRFEPEVEDTITLLSARGRSYFQSLAQGGHSEYLGEYNLADQSRLDFTSGEAYMGFEYPDGEILEFLVGKKPDGGFNFSATQKTRGIAGIKYRMKPRPSQNFTYGERDVEYYKFGGYEVLYINTFGLAVAINKLTGVMYPLPKSLKGNKPRWNMTDFRSVLSRVPTDLGSYHVEETKSNLTTSHVDRGTAIGDLGVIGTGGLGLGRALKSSRTRVAKDAADDGDGQDQSHLSLLDRDPASLNVNETLSVFSRGGKILSLDSQLLLDFKVKSAIDAQYTQ